MVTDNTHDVGLVASVVDGVTHGFAVNGQGFVLLTMGLVPALNGLV